jgi:hypothetical protein
LTQKWVRASKEGRWQEGRRKAERGKGDNETQQEIMSATVKQKKTGFEECHLAPGMRPEKGHLTPEVKMANEIVCDHVWDKLHTPISVTCSKMVYKESPLCSWGSAFGCESAELLPACLINLLPERALVP